ncbi:MULTISPECIES: LysR family transcriptional regulator [Burkholderiaceae]|uniref:LysR family transcriptional regulator n=1 Tax=Burkholderiaceae TaxID=119060 RepID=UPI00095EF245|nr:MULTISPECIES: LysR family transcriptional regulator [Burkholderiaceae]MCG1018133.1 LysR family transcriptional regulator [Mycetohabitans sp. B4]SIT67362.1 transcriptional regulator, LysR family [Burkholderia sp. b13]
MDTLQNMRVFVRVVEAKSFTAAAQQMNTTTAYASRAISDLEAHLRTRLLNRTTRRIALTEAGERYLQRCEQILAYVDQAEAEAADAHARPSGRLRIHATTSFGQYYVVPVVTRYQERYPSVSVDLTLSQHVPDLLDEGYDVTLQVSANELPDSGLVSQRLGDSYSVLCASPAYLEKRGTPRNVRDLAGHTCLRIVTSIFPGDHWRFDGPDGMETIELPAPTFQVNVSDALAVALREGMGIGALLTPSALPALRNGTLVRVLPDHKMQKMTIYAMYASRQYLDAKIRTWVEFLREHISKALAADEAALQTFGVR